MSSEIVRQNQQTADAVSSSATSVYYILKSPKIKDDSKGFLVILYSNCYFSDRHDIRGVFCENATLLQCEAVLFFRGKPGLYGARPAFRRRIRGVSPPAAVQKLITGERKKREKSETVKRAGKTGNHKSI